MPAIVEVYGVRKSYRLGETICEALRGVDLKVERGEFLAVAGPSGSGKTTLLNILGCLDTATGGQVRLEGKDVSGSPTGWRRSAATSWGLSFNPSTCFRS